MKQSNFSQWIKQIKEKSFARRKRYSIDRILWSSFAIFAIFIILITSLFEIFTIRRVLQEQLKDDLSMVVKETYLYIDNNVYLQTNELNDFILYLSVTKNVNARVLDMKGQVLLPNFQGIEGNYTDIVSSALEKLRSDSSKRGLTLTSLDQVYYIGFVDSTKTRLLYISKPLEIVNNSMVVVQVQTFFLSILALVVAFLLSGMIAMRLSKPFTEMTDKAKKLEKGNFEIDFDGQYYYSEVGELASGLNHMRDALFQSDQMQKELIANVSHDMKTPLTMIKAYASMIQEISGDNKVKRTQHTQVIIDEADRLTTLVNEILDLSKIQAGINTLNFSVFNISEYVYAVIQKFDYLSETQGYVFEAEIENDLYVNVDREKIGQVIYNLIGNAVNYTGADKKITVKLYREKDLIHFSVTDTGKGIKEEKINTIWDRYYRAMETHKRPVKGTGLGLSIVKTICEKHNLSYGVKSTVGQGSTFYVHFYAVKAE